MGVEAEKTSIPDEFLQKTYKIDELFADIDMPLSSLASSAVSRHVEVEHIRTPKTREQEAAEFFNKRILPAPLRP